MSNESELFSQLSRLRRVLEFRIRQRQKIRQKDIDELHRIYADLGKVRTFSSKDQYLNEVNINIYSAYMYLYNNQFVESVKQILSYCVNLSKVYLEDNDYNITGSASKIQAFAKHFCDLKGTTNYFDVKTLFEIEVVFDQILATDFDKEIFNKQLFYILRPVYIDIKNNLRGYDESQDTIRLKLNDLIVKSKRIHKDLEKHYSTAILSSIGYKLHKYYMFKLIRTKDYTHISEVCEILKKCAHEALSSHTTFCRFIEKLDSPALLGTKIDYEYSNYYYNYYCNLNPRRSIEALKNIESMLILSKFESDQERTIQINYFERELCHFIIFFKLILLKSEIEHKQKIMVEQWERSLYGGILDKLNDSIGMFRRNNELDSADFDLKIINT